MIYIKRRANGSSLFYAYMQLILTKYIKKCQVCLVDFVQLTVTIVGKGGEMMLKDNLVILRNMVGFSQEEVAEKLGISRQAYAKWEKGQTIPDVESCAVLAELYGVTIDSLLKVNTSLDGAVVSPGPSGKHIFGTVTMNEKGQIVIPKLARDIMKLKSGERLIILGDETEGLALVKAELFEINVQKAIEMVKLKL